MLFTHGYCEEISAVLSFVSKNEYPELDNLTQTQYLCQLDSRYNIADFTMLQSVVIVPIRYINIFKCLQILAVIYHM